nr:DUF305 domain-containing protein [uncultured Halomonas sp.]
MSLSNLVGTTKNNPLAPCRKFNAPVALILATMLIAPLSYAHQHDSEQHSGAHGHHEGAHQQGEDDPAIAAYKAANDKMHQDMAMSFTGNPDVDFAKGMIPHHEGAIAMAEIVLKYGKDEEILQLAEDIIAAQESEIAFLREWLNQQGN